MATTRPPRPKVNDLQPTPIRDLMFKGAQFRIVPQPTAPVKTVVWVRKATETNCELEVSTEGGGVSRLSVALSTLMFV